MNLLASGAHQLLLGQLAAQAELFAVDVAQVVAQVLFLFVVLGLFQALLQALGLPRVALHL